MTEEKNQEIVLSDDKAIEKKEETNLIKSNEVNAIQELEARAKVMNTLIDTVLKMTSPVDWVRYSKSSNFADLSSDGALRIARMLGVSITDVNFKKTQYEDYYEYEYTGTFRLGNSIVVGFGISSSEDKLFSHGGKICMEEVNEPNVRKKAQSQMYRRGIGDLLGIRRMPLDRFPKSWPEQIPVAIEDKGNMQQKPKNLNTELIKKVEKALLDSVSGDTDEAVKKLKSITNSNINSLEDCSDKQLNYILVKINKGE